MRIIQIIQKPQLRGAEIFACQLSNHLIAMGHQVKIVALYGGDVQLPFDGEVVYLGLNRRYRFFDMVGWRKLAKVIETFKAEIVQANAGDTLKYAVFAKIFLKHHPILVFRNASMMSSYIQSPWVKWLYGNLMNKVDHVISVSKMSMEDITKLFPFVIDCVSVIHIGIEARPFIPYRPDFQYVLHVGGFTFEKNHIGLIRIFNSVKIKFPHLKLLLIGDGPLRSEVNEVIKKQGLEESILMLGYQNNVLDYMAGAEALVLPSSIEGLPSVILEAMYCKIPVVAYDVGGIPELVTDLETGFLVSGNDETDFARAVEECIGNQSEIASIVDRAHTIVVENFLLESIALKFESKYEQLLSYTIRNVDFPIGKLESPI